MEGCVQFRLPLAPRWYPKGLPRSHPFDYTGQTGTTSTSPSALFPLEQNVCAVASVDEPYPNFLVLLLSNLYKQARFLDCCKGIVFHDRSRSWGPQRNLSAVRPLGSRDCERLTARRNLGSDVSLGATAVAFLVGPVDGIRKLISYRLMKSPSHFAS
ncbi:hypothetical protein VTK73DRAFT_8832 [Phialemonium thermophilum]|uniref:Uncharacterized protein n=1 Tax=Phialemonium thermophilum TaxID=223376 RepID=A0ABR3W651_9PEZI